MRLINSKPIHLFKDIVVMYTIQYKLYSSGVAIGEGDGGGPPRAAHLGREGAKLGLHLKIGIWGKYFEDGGKTLLGEIFKKGVRKDP